MSARVGMVERLEDAAGLSGELNGDGTSLL